MPKTIIDLTKVNNTKAYEDNNFIQKDAKDKLLARVDEYLKSTESEDRVHNTILIDGKRGYGKSTFMLSVAKTLNQKHKNLCILDTIDPTMIESKENIFLLVLSKINKFVEDCSRHSDHTDEDYKSIQKSFKEVAKGLSVLEGIGDNEPLSHSTWNEPEFILKEGIKKVKGGADLEDNFRKYISKVLTMLNKEAFMLTFDDIDTATNHGKSILELIRKYFISPKLIIILLGDIELYELIARDMQWEKMNPSMSMKYEGEETVNIYKKEIDTLTSQYMLKLLSPRNRIDLKTLRNIKDDISIETINEKQNIEAFTKKLIVSIFRESNRHKDIYFIEYILNQPIRSIMNIFQSFNDNERNLVNVLKDLEHTLLSKLSHDYYHSELHKLLLLFRNKDTGRYYFLYEYMQLMDIKGGDMDFMPDNKDMNRNTLAILLNSEISYGSTSIRDICDYFVICYIPIKFNLNHGSSEHPFKVMRFLTKELVKDKKYFGIIDLKNNDIKKMSLDNNPKQQATFNILTVVIFKNTGIHNYLSFWNIFAFISDAVFGDYELNKLLQLKSFRMDGDDSLLEQTSSLQDNEYNTEKLHDMKSSEDDTKNMKDIKLSNRQIVSIFTRIEYSIRHIDANPSDTAGKQFHRYIIATLNAFIIVVLEDKDGVDFRNALAYGGDRDTLVYSNNVIYMNNKDKLLELTKIDKRYKWLEYFIKLDIWKLFLNNDHDNEHNIFNSLEKISLNKTLALKNIIEMLETINQNRFTKLESGTINDDDKKLLWKSLNAKLNRMKQNQEVTLANANKIKADFNKLP